MRFAVRFLSAAVVSAAVCAAGHALAESTNAGIPTYCDVPASMLASDSQLPTLATAIKDRKRLSVLVSGTRSSSLPGPDGEASAYPARLQAILRERLADVTVDVTTDLQLRKTAEEVASGFGRIVAERRPDLVIWQTGTVDAIRSTDPDEFKTSLDDGIANLKKANVGALLVNLQYSPRTDTVMQVTPYLDAMRMAAQNGDVPLFDRFSIMRDWHETGDFDLFATPTDSDHGLGMAKKLHDCLGRLMAKFVIDAARINPADVRPQR